MRADQAGQTTFPEFLLGARIASVLRYDVGLIRRCAGYFGCDGESCVESYPEVTVQNPRI
ncbi:hypothetical protein [Paraburkholderia sp.]|uniref:hypothetical protein n=1 Tax=Paraburkholderia sp. TaxID=1926495 RepID=UPI0039E63843